MFEIEKHAWTRAAVALVHQHGAALEQIAVALKREVDNRVEEWMARADKGGQGLTLRCHQRLFKGNACVAREYRFADTDQAVAVAHRDRNMGDLVAPQLALLDSPTDTLESLVKKGLSRI